jgi:hypothetical protein
MAQEATQPRLQSFRWKMSMRDPSSRDRLQDLQKNLDPARDQAPIRRRNRGNPFEKFGNNRYCKVKIDRIKLVRFFCPGYFYEDFLAEYFHNIKYFGNNIVRFLSIALNSCLGN